MLSPVNSASAAIQVPNSALPFNTYRVFFAWPVGGGPGPLFFAMSTSSRVDPIGLPYPRSDLPPLRSLVRQSAPAPRPPGQPVTHSPAAPIREGEAPDHLRPPGKNRPSRGPSSRPLRGNREA